MELNVKVTEAMQKILDDHTIDLKGKFYTQVNARAYVFRLMNPNASINTWFDVVSEVDLAVCEVRLENVLLAKAHKMVQTKGKGAAAMYPFESAQTGAIGRALALCGFGTLTGELDEGDQIADAPVTSKGPQPKATASDIAGSIKR